MGKFDGYIGKLIGGRYQIEDVVGVGGMAYVLKASDNQTARDVAMKILSEQYNNDRNAVKRFINESKAISMLHHENIVSVYDVSISEELKYIVMEYVDGVTLNEYMSKKTLLNWREAAKYTIQILNALSHAHHKGIVHRDIKPQNIMLDTKGRIKVTDFGIAKSAANENLTVTDKAIGTVNYISPEQASGDKVTAASDLYSVGVMLYEMVTGTLPFVSDNPLAVATMHVSTAPTSPRQKNPNIPIGLEQIILKAMSKKSENRFSSAQGMAKALTCLMENPETVFSSRNSTAEQEEKTQKTQSGTVQHNTKQKTKKAGSRSMMPIVSGIALSFVVVCIISGIVAVNILEKRNTKDYSAIENKGEKKLWEIIDSIFIGTNGTGTEIKIPSLIGYEYTEELEKALEQNQLRIAKVKYASVKDKPVGSIVAQSPEENAIRKLSSSDSFYELTITVNSLADTIEIPDLSLMSYNAARAMLMDMGVSRNAVIKEEKFDDGVVEGYVISSLPAKGETFDVSGGESIKIYVSAGQQTETTTVPELVGLSVEEAKRKIIEHKLSIGKVTYENSAMEQGTVIRASVEKDTVVPAKLTQVDLYASLGNLMPSQDPNYFNNTAGEYIIDENGNLVYVPEDENQGGIADEGVQDGGFYIDENGNLVYREAQEQQEQQEQQENTDTPAQNTDNSVQEQQPAENEQQTQQQAQQQDNEQQQVQQQQNNTSEQSSGLTLSELEKLLG